MENIQMRLATKIKAIISVTAKPMEEMAHKQIVMVGQRKATKPDQHKAKIQKTCQKQRAIKQCLNQHYLFHQARLGISQTAKIQRDLMKVVATQAEPIRTRIVRIEVVAGDVD
jgi:hypothetical protein